MGSLLVEQGKYEPAMQNLLEAVKYEEEIKDSGNLAMTLSSIGEVYYYMNQ